MEVPVRPEHRQQHGFAHSGLDGYDRMLGLKLHDLAVDGCITRAPCGGQTAGRSPVDRGKQGLKRSVVTDGDGIPLGAVVAGANTHDLPLLAPTLDALDQMGPLPEQPTVHLDRGYDSGKTRQALTERGLNGRVAERGKPAPVQAGGKRWPVERTHAWGNGFGKLRWCTERRRRVVEFWVALAHAIIIRRLIRRAWTCYRWRARAHRRP